MSTNNKWGALSMRDRAFLIREAVRNGITDIGSIRDTWEHRFDGENSHLTEDEYIAYKADSVRQAALNRARNRNTLEAPIIGYEKVSPEAVRSVLEEVFNKEREIQIARQKAMVLGDYGNARSQYEQLIKDRDYWQERYKELQQYSAGKGRPIIGDNCIYTVSGDFGRPVSGNCTFRERHSELGFKEIPFKETSPGDIVQFRSFTGDPVHAMMANTPYNEDTSKMRYNGSSGGTSDKHLRINSSYPIDGTPTPWVYEYVGNRADSLQWKKEYNEKYGHKFSGAENKSAFIQENLTEVDDGQIYRLYNPQTYKNSTILKDSSTGKWYFYPASSGLVNFPAHLEIITYPQARKLLPKRDYIGGTSPEVWKKAAKLIPGMVDSLVNIAERHDINPELIHHRLGQEGFYNTAVSHYNFTLPREEQATYWANLPNEEIDGFEQMGLDTAGSHLEKGNLKLTRPVKYKTVSQFNEDWDPVLSVTTPTLWDALEIKAAMLKRLEGIMQDRGVTGEDLDIYTNAAYNLGEYHKDLKEEHWIKHNYQVNKDDKALRFPKKALLSKLPNDPFNRETRAQLTLGDILRIKSTAEANDLVDSSVAPWEHNDGNISIDVDNLKMPYQNKKIKKR